MPNYNPKPIPANKRKKEIDPLDKESEIRTIRLNPSIAYLWDKVGTKHIKPFLIDFLKKKAAAKNKV